MTQCVRLAASRRLMQAAMDMEDQVAITEIDNALLVEPRFHRLDATVAPAFRDHLVPRLRDRRLVVFALGNIRFMDSSGLGSLVSLLKVLPAGGVVRLAELSPALEKVLTRTRLNNVLPVFPTVALAVNGMLAPPGGMDRAGTRRERAVTGG
jgi:anti-sigma B factor antagonist